MLEGDSRAKTFLGIRFLLYGFDPLEHHQIRSKLVDGGGVDVGHYSPNCTHVIVGKVVYDDPICVAARNDAKTLVTSLWINHSFEVGVPVDATSIIYRPLKDLNGIPAAKRLVVCLTGYLRQDREDIMTMVGLMGAQFSKPLVANKVTHLVCYKFEGEKFELAKKFQNIKLVNHLWLEHCLRDWAILPENYYNKSGYEMEMMEAEARDSEDEAESTFVMQSGVRSICRSPHNIKAGSPATSRLPKLEGQVPKSPRNFNNAMDNLSSLQTENKLNQASCFSNGYVPKGLSGQAAFQFGDSLDGKPNDLLHRTPVPILRSDLASNPGTVEKPADSAGKLSCSWQTSLKSTPPLYVGDKSSHGNGSSKVPICKLNVNEDLATSAMKADQANDKIDYTAVEASLEGTHLQNREESSGMLPQKRTMDLSYASTKSQKTSHDGRSSIMSSPSSHKSTKVIDGLCETDSHHFARRNEHFLDKTGKLNILENATPGVSPTKSSNFVQKPLTCDLPFSPTLILETALDGNISNKTPLTTFQSIRKSSLSSKPDTVDCVVETAELQNQHQDVGGLSPNSKKSVTKNSNDPADLNWLKGGNSDSVTEPLRKKMMAKKILGSRPKFTSFNSKASGYIDEDASLNNSRLSEKSPSSITLDVFSPEVNAEAPKELADKDATKSADIADNKSESMDDETEAPEEEDEPKLENVLHEARPIGFQSNNTARTFTEENSEQVQRILDDSDARVHGDAMASVDNTKGVEQQKVVSDKIPLLVESTSEGEGVEGKKNKEKKRPLGKTKLGTVLAVTELMEPKKVVSEDDTNESGGETEEELEKGQPKLRSAPKKKLESTSKLKENMPIICADQNVKEAEPQAVKSMVNSHITASKKNQTSLKIDPKSSTPDGEGPSRVKTQPTCFILSGHRFQRKDFQQVIRRLKGRCCRDSHHWSYQATHFIVPDPIRRTEKFFAAAASGRWILKSDYLAASNQAGRLLAEEPHEWYKNGLSEDGAINLEAPRKWRLLRERTGHGAFHGMRIILYGECIAPTLDTIKRAVKAGDGTILATSPPYTRFLNWGVDFAIVSPGMPHADMWVQEFLKHEIPCVVADYLVEYVCKPGYPLDRHVLYNTHAWAEKSFGSLQSRAEEIVEEDLTPTDDSGNKDDIPCVVCGSGERGEVMLICGNDSGSMGCGVGTHIDCCNPPLEDVPKDDWFCPKCSGTEKGRNPSKKRKKGKSK